MILDFPENFLVSYEFDTCNPVSQILPKEHFNRNKVIRLDYNLRLGWKWKIPFLRAVTETLNYTNNIM